MIKLVSVCRYDIRDRKRVRYHDFGTYKPAYPYESALDASLGRFVPNNPQWEDDKSYNNGRQYTKCGILTSENPFGIGKTNATIDYHIVLRQDHAEKFASPCKRCFPNLI